MYVCGTKGERGFTYGFDLGYRFFCFDFKRGQLLWVGCGIRVDCQPCYAPAFGRRMPDQTH